MVARRRRAVTPPPWTRLRLAVTTAEAAVFLVLVATPTLPADAFAAPPSALSSPSTWLHETTTARTATMSEWPISAATTALSRSSISADASECGYVRTGVRIPAGGESVPQRFSSRPARPLASACTIYASIPENSGGEEVRALLGDNLLLGASNRDDTQDKFDGAETPARSMDKANGGQPLKGQKELEGDRGVEEDDQDVDDHDAEVKGIHEPTWVLGTFFFLADRHLRD